MKRSNWPLLATLLATALFAAPASAQDISLVSCEGGAVCDGAAPCNGGVACDGLIGGKSVVGSSGLLSGCDSCDSCGGYGGCDSCCGNGCSRAGLYAEAEILFFKYDRADGNRVGSDFDERVMTDHEVAPRFTIGYVTDSGLGYRMRYFQFDQANTTGFNDNETLGIDTWTVDFELFERIQLNRNWTIELSGGVRYNEFDEEMIDFDGGVLERRINAFDGWGGIIGLQANRRIGQYWGVYGRVRGAIMVEDVFRRNTASFLGQPITIDEDLIASTQGMMELAIGWEYNRPLNNGALLFARLGYEFQTWYNYSSAFDGSGIPLLAEPESLWAGPSDVGFHGWALSLGIER